MVELVCEIGAAAITADPLSTEERIEQQMILAAEVVELASRYSPTQATQIQLDI